MSGTVNRHRRRRRWRHFGYMLSKCQRVRRVYDAWGRPPREIDATARHGKENSSEGRPGSSGQRLQSRRVPASAEAATQEEAPSERRNQFQEGSLNWHDPNPKFYNRTLPSPRPGKSPTRRAPRRWTCSCARRRARHSRRGRNHHRDEAERTKHVGATPCPQVSWGGRGRFISSGRYTCHVFFGRDISGHVFFGRDIRVPRWPTGLERNGRRCLSFHMGRIDPTFGFSS